MQLTDFASRDYLSLTLEEKQYLHDQGILNGFGGASQSWIVRRLIGSILEDFDTAIPDYHDYGYFIGGDEDRRKLCDERFYQAMLDDIHDRYELGMIDKWGIVHKSFIALGAWSAIRWRGSQFFHYT